MFFTETYERAVEKLGSLEKGRNAFTTDDESASEIKSRMENALRQKSLKIQTKLLQEKFLTDIDGTNASQKCAQSTSKSASTFQEEVHFAGKYLIN